MDIYILREGAQTGPYSEDEVQSLLKQGSVLINDLAWTTGAPQWLPLHAVLYPAAQPNVPPPPPVDQRPPAMPGAPVDVAAEAAAPTEVAPTAKPAESRPAGEPATPRQKAFLTYVSVPFSSDLTKERAALLVNDAMEDSKNSARIKRWDEERLRLYPDLFADEIKTKRENRPQYYLEVCLGDGTEFFEGVTKAHTQVLVGYLDVHHPGWEQNPKRAAVDYLFPALAEKFPQLLKKGAKGRFKYPDGPKVAADLVRRPAVVRGRPTASPVAAAVRGMFVGVIVLGVAFAAYQVYIGAWKLPTVPANLGTKIAAKPSPAAAKTGDAAKPAATPTQGNVAQAASTPAETLPAVKPAPGESPLTASLNPAANPAPSLVPAPAPAPAPGEAPMAPGADPAKPAMADSAPAGTPVLPGGSLFDSTPPPAVPPAPIPGENGVPAAATPAPAAPHPAIARITKPTVITLKFGSSTIRPGTPVQVLAAEGANLRIRFGPDVVVIPAGNTDYVAEGAAPPPPQ